jgi:hypothetical protein
VRVGRFVGRLGVVSLPAVEVGLGLDERVVRRHVAKLEAAGWLIREPWIWGEGSVVWLTSAGIEGVRLGGLRPVKSPPGATTIAHGVLVGWSAARVEHRGRVWKSSRELAVERERWAITARCERGYTELLPDLAVWFGRSEPPAAVITESGGRREDRQKQILEAWRDAILSGRYSDVHYHCSDASVAHWIARLAKKVGLTSPAFVAETQLGAEEIAALPPAAEDEPDTIEPQPQLETPAPPVAPVPVAPIRAVPDPVPVAPIRAVSDPTPVATPEPEPPAPPQAELPNDAAQHPLYREVFGTQAPPRRRWRH